MGGRGRRDPVILEFDYFENIWTDVHSKLCFQDRNCHFLTYLVKKPMEIACFFLRLLHKNQFLPIFYTQNDYFSIFEGVLILWRHSEVIHKWLVPILVSMERRCSYLYTGSKCRVIWPSALIMQAPSGKLGKTLRRTKVNCILKDRNFKNRLIN